MVELNLSIKDITTIKCIKDGKVLEALQLIFGVDKDTAQSWIDNNDIYEADDKISLYLDKIFHQVFFVYTYDKRGYDHFDLTYKTSKEEIEQFMNGCDSVKDYEIFSLAELTQKTVYDFSSLVKFFSNMKDEE